jgi:PDDEXK-like domain of unknown function (DUF3799)
MKIERAGIYTDMSSVDYFEDPCPQPSLTQSIAKILLDQSPLHAWHAHPRLNPDWRPDDPTKFDVGNIAHKLMIGRGKEIVVLDQFNDWRTKAAQEAREAAAADGKLAVLGKKFALADRMVRAAREQLELRGLGNLFAEGAGEVVTAWQQDGYWCRQMIDWLSPDRLIFCDYKTTEMSAAPHGLGRMMVNAGWPIQAAMGEIGLKAVDPLGSRRRFLFIVQETERPYALNVVEMSESALTMGRKMLAMAFHIWKDCITSNRWPGYPLEIIVPDYPGYAEASWLDREQTEFGQIVLSHSDLIMAG